MRGNRSGIAWKDPIDLYLYHSHQVMLLEMPLGNGYGTDLQVTMLAATLSLGVNRRLTNSS